MAEKADNLYQLALSQDLIQRIRSWATRAAKLNLVDQLVATLQAIHQTLTTEPLIWGDPQFHYQHLDLRVYRGIQDMLYVYYAVDEKRRIVYVKDLILRPGHPLGEES